MAGPVATSPGGAVEGVIAAVRVRQSRRYRRAGAVLLGRVAVAGLLVAAWAVASTATYLIPSPAATVEALVRGFRDGQFGSPLWATMKAILVGFAISTVAGLIIGILLGRSRFWGRVFDPIILVFYSVPRLIVYPVLIGFFGITFKSELYLAVLSGFFPIVVNTIAGVRSVSPTLTKLGRSLSASRLQVARHILIPASAGAIVVGLRISWSTIFVTVTAAELFASKSGIGQLLQRAYSFAQYDIMFALVLLLLVIALVGSAALGGAERWMRSSGLD
jgi:NitT/TauT family transport system permease protein